MADLQEQIDQIRSWYGLLKVLDCFPNPLQNYSTIYVAEREQKILGFIQVSPENDSRSTWRVERVITNSSLGSFLDHGSQLLRYCFEKLWEARTWILEVNIQQVDSLALYRQNGFQPIAHLTYWSLSPEKLTTVAQRSPELANLMPVSNAEAQLLYQLDCVSMPPLLRQVYDLHPQDFKKGLLTQPLVTLKNSWSGTEIKEAFVFEPQRKAAIAYFCLKIAHNQAHQLKLTVHPAYTWLYEPVLCKIAQIISSYGLEQNLELVSADYQPEREEYLERIGADRVKHNPLMSRSVWHKLREVRQEGLQLSDVLQGLKPSSIPTRLSSFTSISQMLPLENSEIQTFNNHNDKSRGNNT